jgi:hypothetical protein
VHVTVPDRTPSEQEYTPLPVWAYAGVLHVGMHESPLASRLDVHVPKAPFVGAVIVHGFGLHANVLVYEPYEHDLLPDAVYPLLHVGVHEAPLSRLAGHVPMAPFVGAVTEHGLPARTAQNSSPGWRA